MKQELVEKVAEQMIAFDNADISPDSTYVVLARYAIALAERAAREAWRDGWFEARGSVPGLGCHINKQQVEAAVERAVEGA